MTEDIVVEFKNLIVKFNNIVWTDSQIMLCIFIIFKSVMFAKLEKVDSLNCTLVFSFKTLLKVTGFITQCIVEQEVSISHMLCVHVLQIVVRYLNNQQNRSVKVTDN